MRNRAMFCLMLLALLVSACQGPPPTQIVLVVTATPAGGDAQTEATAQEAESGLPAAPEETARPPAVSAITIPPAAATARQGPQIMSVTLPPATAGPLTFTPAAEFMSASRIAPTPTILQIQVAEQIFENGRMFWIEPTREIWVLVLTEEGRGHWSIHDDSFLESEPEYDPAIVPPRAGLRQPIRGFGKIWRENPELRAQLGWATTEEFGFVTDYEHHPGGYYEDGEYIYGPGHYVLYSLYDEGFRFEERDATWRLR